MANKPPKKKSTATKAKAAKSAKAAGKSTAKSKPSKAAKPKASKAAKPDKAAKVAASKVAKAPAAKPAGKAAAAAKQAPAKPAKPGVAPAAPDPKGANARKGITIVTPKPVKKEKKPSGGPTPPPGLGRLLDPKNPIRRPLIPSGPKAAQQRPLGQHGGVESESLPTTEAKTPFNRRELDRFRGLLLKKRAELLGDVATIEKSALNSDAGSLSNMPSHIAEQGSDASDQALSLDLAAADRKLIREIDDALKRIEDGTYGVCEMTGKPIKVERLEELPWARYSIEAARELERLAMRQ